MSSISFIRVSSMPPASAMSAEYSSTSGFVDVRITISFRPSIVLIGVRISWLMRARNSVFAVFAAFISSIRC